MREKLGMSTRRVADMSRRVAVDQNRADFRLSHAWLTQVESCRITPSLFKLYTLSAIYGTALQELLALYLDVDALPYQHLALNLAQTRVASLAPPASASADEVVTVVDTGSPGSRPEDLPEDRSEEQPDDQTALVDALHERHELARLTVLGAADKKGSRYGVIGTNDYRMYPLLRPGSVVQIDVRRRRVTSTVYRTEYDRPLYFVELHKGYICSWCDLQGGRLISIPHPLSPYRVQEFRHPEEAEIVGRVSAVMARWGG
jgi:hypothetical protein